MTFLNFIRLSELWPKMYWIYSNYRLWTGSDGALPTVYWISGKCQGRKRIQCHRRSESIKDMDVTYISQMFIAVLIFLFDYGKCFYYFCETDMDKLTSAIELAESLLKTLSEEPCQVGFFFFIKMCIVIYLNHDLMLKNDLRTILLFIIDKELGKIVYCLSLSWWSYAPQGVIVQKKEKRAAVKEGENAELLT